MLRKPGFVANNGVRLVYGLGLILLILLWGIKLSSQGLSPTFTTTTEETQPRLNTSWHRQIAQELSAGKTNLTGVDTPSGILDRTRVALLIENRPLPYLIPLLLHFMTVVPPEWSFRFMGSEESIAMMESNPTVRRYIERKKLFLDLIPYNIVPNVNGYTEMNILLSRAWLYEEWLWPAEWLFLFQDDSMICSASKLTLNDFVNERWSFLGASGTARDRPHSTGGGLSLRYVPHLIKQLRTFSFEEWGASGRIASEDYYFSMAMWDLPGAKMPMGPEAIRWGVVFEYSENSDEMPFGFHPYSSDGMFRGANGQLNQNRAYAYCPELAIISVGRWDCQCSPNPHRPGGLGG